MDASWFYTKKYGFINLGVYAAIAPMPDGTVIASGGGVPELLLEGDDAKALRDDMARLVSGMDYTDFNAFVTSLDEE